MSISSKKHNILSNVQLAALKRYLPERYYQKDTEVIYRGHIPQVGFILLFGKMYLKKTRIQTDIVIGEVHGVRELYSNSPYRYTVGILKGSSVLIIDRSSLTELQNTSDNEVRDIITHLL